MASMNDKDYYAILGVDHDATEEQIRKAFQQKARKLHPDINKEPDAEERFKEVSEAYAVLSDPDKRRRYDAMQSGSPFAASGGYGSPSAQGDPFGGMGGFWGFPFGGGFGSQRTARSRSRAYNPQAGGDVVYQLDIDEKQAREGCRKGVTYQRYVACEVCHGMGSVHTDHARTCPTCGGSGHISVDLASLFGIGVMNMVCPECEGSGKVVADPCDSCGGSGRVLSASEVVVDVPAGSHDGDTVRVSGMGNAGTNGSTSGDFVCRVGVPSERLSPRAAQGFQMIGFALPFIILGLTVKVLVEVAAVFSLPLCGIGIWLILKSGGFLHHGSRWWKNAGSYLVNGAVNGATVAIFMSFMVSCMSGLGTAGYTGAARLG